MNPFHIPFFYWDTYTRAIALSYLAWWSYDYFYLCEKLDLTYKRNHISSFIFFSLYHGSDFFFAFNSLVRFIAFISLILMTFRVYSSALLTAFFLILLISFVKYSSYYTDGTVRYDFSAIL